MKEIDFDEEDNEEMSEEELKDYKLRLEVRKLELEIDKLELEIEKIPEETAKLRGLL